MVALKTSFLDSLSYLENKDQLEIKNALEKTEEWHKDQQRESGEPYVIHPINVALYLAKLEAEKTTIIAALVHDVVEDGHASLEEIEELFGPTVKKLVDGVTKLTKFEYKGERTERQIASLRKMLLTANDDLRVIFIKLADRWHNISTLSALRPDKQERVARETLDIYVPFARLVGLWELKSFFEATCFPIAYPEKSSRWKKIIQERRQKFEKERMDFIASIHQATKNHINARLNLMTDYEIYEKFQGNVHQFEKGNIDSVHLMSTNKDAQPEDCYRIMGEIHLTYPVRIGLFRDYISVPQPNGYRALHTTVFLSKNHEVRLRIQTQQMYDYGSRRKLSTWLKSQDYDVLQSLGTLNRNAALESNEYVRNLKDLVLKERINVFTSAGEVVTLPQNATGVDFAFIMNPDNLSSLVGVKINGEDYTATQQLHESDTVDLILAENSGQDLQSIWLNRVKSPEAKEKIKIHLQNIPETEKQKSGKILLKRECQKRKLPQWLLFNVGAMQRSIAVALKKDSFETLLEEISDGIVSAEVVLDKYNEILAARSNRIINFLKLFRLLPRVRVLDKESSVIRLEVYTKDRPGMIYDISKCFADRGINMASFQAYAVPNHEALYRIDAEVRNFEEFSDLYDSLLSLPNVREILRKS